MKTYAALFRGINVGGKHLLPMKELVALLEDLGYRNVKTYIQSGNAVFATDETDRSQLSHRISSEIKQRRAFEPYVLLLRFEELEKAVSGNPFPEAEGDPKGLHLGFLSSEPRNPDLAGLRRLQKDGEQFELIDKVFYLHAPQGVGNSKLAANAERLLGVTMTDRNWRTVCKILEMAKESN